MEKKQLLKHLDLTDLVRRRIEFHLAEILFYSFTKYFPVEEFEDAQLETVEFEPGVHKVYYRGKLLATIKVKDTFKFDLESPIFNE